MSRYIGIDPGVSGGIAVLDESGKVLNVRKMPDTETDLFEHLGICNFGPGSGGTRAVLEYVRAMPKMGVASMFEFGRGYGAVRMALLANRIPFEEVTPQKWQKTLGCRTGGNKNISKARAQELFPGVKVTHAIADALLLAEYARRLECRK